MKTSRKMLALLPGVGLPLAIALTATTIPVGPGLSAQTPVKCTLKAQWDPVEKKMHCHDEGTTCEVNCPEPE